MNAMSDELKLLGMRRERSKTITTEDVLGVFRVIPSSFTSDIEFSPCAEFNLGNGVRLIKSGDVHAILEGRRVFMIRKLGDKRLNTCEARTAGGVSIRKYEESFRTQFEIQYIDIDINIDNSGAIVSAEPFRLKEKDEGKTLSDIFWKYMKIDRDDATYAENDDDLSLD